MKSHEKNAWVTLSICRSIIKQTERVTWIRHGRSGTQILRSFIIPLNLLVKRKRKTILLSASLKSLIT